MRWTSSWPGAARRRSRSRIRLLPLVLCALAIGDARGTGGPLRPPPEASLGTESSWRWRRVAVAGGVQEEGLVAVATAAGPPFRAAVGDLDGVSVRVGEGVGEGLSMGVGGRVGEGAFRFAARVQGVTDLAFAPDGDLWIASLDGLWRLSADGRLSDRSPAPGELARVVRRVAASGRHLAVATEAGAWLRRPGGDWERIRDGLFGAVASVALDEASGAVWLVHGEDVWRVGLAPGSPAELVSISGAPHGVAPVDVVAGSSEGVAVLYPRALALPFPGDEGSPPRLRVVRPAWPPGAVARRLTAGRGRWWLATDLGLLRARDLAGAWRRSEAPAGSAPVRSVAASGDGDGVLAATGMGLLHGAPVLLVESGVGPAGSPDAPRLDPDIRSVHAASLRYLDLGPERFRELRAGLRVRGWLPVVSLRVAGARDRAWQRDDDESFVSGETRYLNDRGKDKSLDLEASVVMTWSLGDLAFDTDAIDLSREHRQVVGLRDNVIDEINQLYFERRSLLEKLHAADAAAPERAALELRAAELAAGLDAWTGGWFSRQPTHPPTGLRPTEEVPR